MERTYRLSFIAYITIHVLAILFYLILAIGSGHRMRFDLKDYLIFSHPVLTLFLMAALKVWKGNNERVLNIIRVGLGLLLFISLYFALHLLISSYQENLDVSFMVISHIIIIAFFVLNFTVLFGLIRKKI